MRASPRLLGIKKRLDALRAIESGDVDPAHFDTLDDDWDVETRSLATLDRSAFPLSTLIAL